jgi:hypothetical protein
MAFKDNVGMTEELSAEMVDTPPNTWVESIKEQITVGSMLEEPHVRCVAFVENPVHIVWITREGKIVGEEVVRSK